MDKDARPIFNHQDNDASGVGVMAYGQGKHQELLEALETNNLAAATAILSSVPHPERLLAMPDPTYRQVILYKAVIMPEQHGIEFVRLFLEKGAKVDTKDIHGQSPMFYICKDGKVGILELFLAHGADINETDNFRQTPLFYASRDGQTATIRKMIEHKANVNHRDKAEQTPLFYAARENRVEAAKALVEGGADVNAADGKKQTPLFYARKDKAAEMDAFLISEGAINTKDGILRQADMRRSAKARNFISAKNEKRGKYFGGLPAQGTQVSGSIQEKAQGCAGRAARRLQAAVHRRQPKFYGCW